MEDDFFYDSSITGGDDEEAGNGGGNALTNWISTLGTTTTGIIGALNRPDVKKPATTKSTTTPTWLPLVLGIGGAVLLIGLLFALLRR